MSERPKDQAPRFNPLILFLLIIGVFFMADWFQFRRNLQPITYSEFLADLNQGKVSEVILGSNQIMGVWKSPGKGQSPDFVTPKVDDPNLVQKLTAANVKFSGANEPSFWNSLLGWLALFFIFSMIWSVLLRGRGEGLRPGGGILSMSRSKAKVHVQTELKTRFNDVAGVDEAKEELQEVVNFLKNPAKYSKLGGRMPKGIVLLGPPGTGKTLLARAVAGEAGVPFFSINGSEFVELFVGLGATRVRDLFREARSKTPCILFIDELDALGKARGISLITGSGNDEKEQTLNQLLAEMDGFDPSEGIIILAATNRPEVLDPALLRAGRFDRQILVDKPDRLGREKILNIHLKGIKLAKEVNISSIASITVGFSGADLANLCNEAALIATRRDAEAVTTMDFTQAVERVVGGLERKNRIITSDEKKRVAYHEMGHATVSFALGLGEIVHKVSIIPRGIGALGYTMRRPIEDRFLLTRRELESKMAIALAGRASEAVFFDDISTGAGDDLDKATEIARAMVTQFGMGQKLGLAVFEREPSLNLLGQPPTRTLDYSEATAETIDTSVQELLNQGYRRARDVIVLYKDLIEEAVKILLVEESMDEKKLKELWERHAPLRLVA
jgi:cell division protease FtsH